MRSRRRTRSDRQPRPTASGASWLTPSNQRDSCHEDNAMSVSTDPVRTAAPRRAPVHKAHLSEGARAERRLAWMLCAPAAIIMIAVTAYPVLYAAYLSLKRYDLRFPKQAKFIGFANYSAVLSSKYWW